MQNEKILNFLSESHLFSLLSESEIAALLPYLSPLAVTKDAILFNEGDEGNELFIVESGAIESYVTLADGNMRSIAVFRRGEFFGEMAMFEDDARSATCHATEDSSVFRLTKASFFELMHQKPSVSNRIMFALLAEISSRLADSNVFLSEMVTWGDSARKRAVTDELTGVFNRRYFDERLHDIFTRSEAGRASFSVIMIDIDHFKRVNAELPLSVVNGILRIIAETLDRASGDDSVFARYGGDEFVVLMTGADRDAACSMAENLKTAVKHIDYHELTDRDDLSVTISQGIASYPYNTIEKSELIPLADRALYMAKEGGRDRAVCIETEQESGYDKKNN